ncbi:hypothetical protein [Erythrobacter sp. Alg231-14]|uniref:hypothetical protein n=1 Tax=Erythrobacter sp. Alg231-14 TaxID=1922225 RepID=UPI00307B99D6
MSESYGKSTLRWQQEKDGTFAGVVIADGKRSEILRDEDEARLLVRLKNEAGKLEPLYVGMQGAIDRFLSFMPGGFSGERNLGEERDYKLNAHRQLLDTLSLEKAKQATIDDALNVRKAGVWINLLSPYESMHLKEALEGPNGAAFLQAAAKFADGDVNAGAQGMHLAIKKHGRLSWPTATYFPFLWQPTKHMFLKPTVTRDFAERIGHPFQYDYEAEVTADTYNSLIDLAEETMKAVKPLGARDLIDVQSFIWVVGAYREEDKPG